MSAGPARSLGTWAHRYGRPDGSVAYGPSMPLGAVLLGDPDHGGVCPDYPHLGYAMRVQGGWWRTKTAWRKGDS